MVITGIFLQEIITGFTVKSIVLFALIILAVLVGWGIV